MSVWYPTEKLHNIEWDLKSWYQLNANQICTIAINQLYSLPQFNLYNIRYSISIYWIDERHLLDNTKQVSMDTLRMAWYSKSSK